MYWCLDLFLTFSVYHIYLFILLCSLSDSSILLDRSLFFFYHRLDAMFHFHFSRAGISKLFSVQGHTASTSGFKGHTVCYNPPGLPRWWERATENTFTNGHGCMLINLYLHRQRAGQPWPAGHCLLNDVPGTIVKYLNTHTKRRTL